MNIADEQNIYPAVAPQQPADIANEQNVYPAVAPQQPADGNNQAGSSAPNTVVVALTPETLLETNQKPRQRVPRMAGQKRVYICPEPTCVHHHPSRALGDLTGMKKHYRRKHGQKKWKCSKCSKCYAVFSDMKAHQKTCSAQEYKCKCGIVFSRIDSFTAHGSYCSVTLESLQRGLGHSHQPADPPVLADFDSLMVLANVAMENF